MHAPHHIPAVPSDEDVFCTWTVDYRVEWRVCLDESPMRLCFEKSEGLLVCCDTHVQPWKDIEGTDFVGAGEDQPRDNLLHPGCAGCGPGADDDVVVSELEVVPDPGVEVVILDLVCFGWSFWLLVGLRFGLGSHDQYAG